MEGVPLGLLPGRTHQILDLQLRTGDAVVVATDGIEESHDGNGTELGRKAVKEVLSSLPAGASAHAVAHALTDAADRHAGDREPSDDRTGVVLKLAER